MTPRLHGPPELRKIETCAVCGREYPADLSTDIPVCQRVACPDRGDPDYRPEPWVAEVRVWAPGGIEVAYGAESFEGWDAGPEAVDAAVEKAIELLYRAGESAKLGLGVGRPL